MPPRVALESTVIAHGLPHPENVETALRLEEIVWEEDVEPHTIGIVEGRAVVGLSEADIRHLATSDAVRKVSWRDVPVVTARGMDGATTVAATMWLAHRYGIDVLATGGIGGVHRRTGPGPSYDVSNDLEALGRLPMVVVCAGAKAILDLPATREALETRGVTVVGYRTDEMPAFYSRRSGLSVDVRCDTPEDVAAIVQARQAAKLPGATLVTVPPPEEVSLSRDEVAPAIDQALAEAEQRELRAAELTPFLLERIGSLTGGRTLVVNRVLLERNARVAARIARALAPSLLA